MNEPLIISDVVGRSQQGATRPFLCRGEDWRHYYVKGDYAGKNSLCCEWVANRLANLIISDVALKLPEFRMGEVPVELVASNTRPDIRELGEGRVFASRKVEGGDELTWRDAQGWADGTMALLMLLDLWLQNEDRSLSEKGGNPNMLVTRAAMPAATGSEDVSMTTLWAYDFNLAFDEDFRRERFFEVHVFGKLLRRWPDGFRERMEPLMRDALAELPAIFAELPLEWLYVDGDESLPVQLDIERLISVLELPFTDYETFWKLP